ncbi:MAG: hypothetical protein AAFQ98_14965 [Bacteroidota bacterium]
MKKYYHTLVLVLLAATATQAQSLEEILEAHFEVTGLEASKEVETIIMKGTASQMGMEFPVIAYQKRTEDGLKQRTQMEFQGQVMVINAWNGEEGWKRMPSMNGGVELQDLTAEELEELEDGQLEGQFYNWEERGVTLTLLDEEEFQGSPIYAIQIEKENGNKSVAYLDQEAYVVIGNTSTMSFQGQQMSTTQIMGNYDMFEGMAMPMSIDTQMNGQTMITITFQEILVNEEIDDELFERPAN